MVAKGIISIEHISKGFPDQKSQQGKIQILEDVSLHIEPGSFVSIIGPSGCGKSTLLRMISGFLFPDEGTVQVDGKEVKGPGVDRGFMFQDHVLFPWLTIYDNIAFGLKAQGVYPDLKDNVDKIIHKVGLDGYADHYPYQVSGGMQQRASLARALIGRPKILLLDEPLGALDAFTRMTMQDEIHRVWEESHTTMIMVTHDIEEAIYMAQKVVVLSSHPGRIIKEIPIQLQEPIDRESVAFNAYKTEILEALHYGEQPSLQEDRHVG
ncbi:MAG TPA: ABC transporter ATP-binding protein [Dialister sp.]|nr:ABC transporter ATP-binding protein [Dialister sp.]